MVTADDTSPCIAQKFRNLAKIPDATACKLSAGVAVGCNHGEALSLGHDDLIPMKKIVLILIANTALCVAPAFAQELATAGGAASGSTRAGADDQAKTSGDQGELRCSKDNPYIEYRDCVNASTRDNNAKVRMAQAAPTARHTGGRSV